MADAAVAHVEARARPVRRVVDIGCGTGAGLAAPAVPDYLLRAAHRNAAHDRFAGTLPRGPW
jgi:predicted TPR repeat methyltransferase